MAEEEGVLEAGETVADVHGGDVADEGGDEGFAVAERAPVGCGMQVNVQCYDQKQVPQLPVVWDDDYCAEGGEEGQTGEEVGDVGGVGATVGEEDDFGGGAGCGGGAGAEHDDGHGGQGRGTRQACGED